MRGDIAILGFIAVLGVGLVTGLIIIRFRFGAGIALVLALAAPATATATATAAAFAILVPPVAPLLALGAVLGVLDLFDVVVILGQVDIVIILDQRRVGDDTLRTGAAGFDRHARTLNLAIGQDFDAHAIAQLDLVQFAALVVEDVEGRFLAGAQGDEVAATARRFLLQHAQRAEAR